MNFKSVSHSRARAKPEKLTPELIVVPAAELKLRRLLVAVDFSECSRKALEYAISLARQFKSEILLLHAVETLPMGPPNMFMTESIALNADLREQSTERLAQWSGSVNPEIPARALVEIGGACETIVRVARENKSDLIVIGTHGRTGLERFFLGGTANRVLRHAPCPVLVVRERESDAGARAEKPLRATRRPRSFGKRTGHLNKHQKNGEL